MRKVLDMVFVGFKGKNNSSSMLVESMPYPGYLLTNSFEGLKKDIDNMPLDCDNVYLFGVDKNLKDLLRIEQAAEKDGINLTSKLDLTSISQKYSSVGIVSTKSANPTRYLCNEAYFYLLQKYNGNAVLIHIPTIKYFNEKLATLIRKSIAM